MLGNNPAQLQVGDAYIDLGAVVTDAANDNIGIHTFLDGTEMQQIRIDTSTSSKYTITYKATDRAGNATSIDRIVYIYDKAAGPPVPQSQVQNLENNPPPPPAVPPAVPPVATSTPDTSSTATTTPPTDTATTTPDTTPDITPPDTTASSTPDTTASSTPDAPVPDATPDTFTASSTDGI